MITMFEVSRGVFWSLLHYKELKLTIKPFRVCTLCYLLIQMQNISLRSLGMHRKQTFEIVFEFKSDTAVLTFTFRFLSSFLFSLFLPHVFFFAEYLVGFILVGKVFKKAFRKRRWVLEQDFHAKFSLFAFS